MTIFDQSYEYMIHAVKKLALSSRLKGVFAKNVKSMKSAGQLHICYNFMFVGLLKFNSRLPIHSLMGLTVSLKIDLYIFDSVLLIVDT